MTWSRIDGCNPRGKHMASSTLPCTYSPILNLIGRGSFKKPKVVFFSKHPNVLIHIITSWFMFLQTNDINLRARLLRWSLITPTFWSLLMPRTLMNNKCKFIERMWKMEVCYASHSHPILACSLDDDLLKLLHKLKLGNTSLFCWVFLHVDDFPQWTLATLLNFWQTPLARISASTLPKLRLDVCNIFTWKNDKILLAVEPRDVGDVGVDMSSITSTKTSRSFSFVNPMCLGMKA